MNGEQEPDDIDPDNDFYADTDITIREKMVKIATYAFEPGWDRRYYGGTSD